jgi:hypothetical protein
MHPFLKNDLFYSNNHHNAIFASEDLLQCFVVVKIMRAVLFCKAIIYWLSRFVFFLAHAPYASINKQIIVDLQA